MLKEAVLQRLLLATCDFTVSTRHGKPKKTTTKRCRSSCLVFSCGLFLPHACTHLHRHTHPSHMHAHTPFTTSVNIPFPCLTFCWESFFICVRFFFSPPQSRFLRGRAEMSKWEARSWSLCQDAPERTRRENKWWWNKKPTSPSAAREVIASESGNSKQGRGQAVVGRLMSVSVWGCAAYCFKKTHASNGEAVQSASSVVNHSHNNAAESWRSQLKYCLHWNNGWTSLPVSTTFVTNCHPAQPET